VIWADGWPVDRKGDAGEMIPGARLCLVLHTTEGSWESAYAALDRNNNWPHLMAEPWPGGRKVQAVPFDRAGKSLANAPGGVETNRYGTIQIELIGFAADTHEWSNEQVDYLAALLKPIIDGLGIRHVGQTFYGEDAGFTLATANAPQRMSPDEWLAWDGIAGHQHVPENDHWDPGKFRIDRFLAGLTGTPSSTGGNTVYHMVIDGPAAGNPRTFKVDGLMILDELPYGNPRGAYAIHVEALDAAAKYGIPIVDGRKVPPFGKEPLIDTVSRYTAAGGRVTSSVSAAGGPLNVTLTGQATPA
jgi:hypothetical protein